jgi:hypothetical protein
VDSVVAETGIALYPRLFTEDVVVLTFKVSHDFLKAIDKSMVSPAKWARGEISVLIVNVVTETCFVVAAVGM